MDAEQRDETERVRAEGAGDAANHEEMAREKRPPHHSARSVTRKRTDDVGASDLAASRPRRLLLRPRQLAAVDA